MESISLGFPHVVVLPRHLNVYTPLFWIQHCYELLWTLHCPKGRYCAVTIIRPLLFHGMRTDLRGSPGAAIVDCQSIYYLLDFERICFIFPWNNSTYDLDATVGWLKSLGYSINARAFGPLTPHLAVGLAGVTMCTRVNNCLWNHIFCHFKASLFLFQLVCVLDKRNTVGTPYNTNVGVQKIPDRAIWKPVVAKRNNTNPWSCSKPQILVTRDSREVHMARWRSVTRLNSPHPAIGLE